MAAPGAPRWKNYVNAFLAGELSTLTRYYDRLIQWLPQFPADLEKKCAQRQVVIYAVVEKDGKVGHIAVKQTPDTRLSDPIVQALSKWVFRPAQLNNQPIAVKVLLGIPL